VQDGLGRRLPQIEGCFILHANEVFLVSTDVQTSWDSRYFGPVKHSDVLGIVRYFGNGEGTQSHLGGWARAEGVEGKIKDNSAPWALSPCLHICFGSAPKLFGGTPLFKFTAALRLVWGSTPYPQDHSTSRNPPW